MEKDVRQHSVVPLTAEHGARFLPGASFVESEPAEGRDGGIPIPLERIQPSRGDRVTAEVVCSQYRAGRVEINRFPYSRHLVVPVSRQYSPGFYSE